MRWAWARLRRAIRWIVRRVVLAALAVALVCVLWVGAYRWIDPPITYLIASEWIRLGGVHRQWRDLDEISPHIARAAIAAEDARFCAHSGFDFDAIRAAIEADGRRGGSTITQQVAKNAFLWPERSWLRKGLEAGFAVLIELTWPKARIMEVYLNVAETDEGVFGAEAAARVYFDRSAADVTLRQAARIAAVLPNPKGRSAADPTARLARRAAAIADGAETLRRSGAAACVDTG